MLQNRKRKRRKRVTALFLALALGATPAVQSFRTTQIVAEALPEYYEEWTATGLKFFWSDIPDTEGKIFGWPRKCYFEGGNGQWTDMVGRYVYCIANHSEQPDMGSPVYVITRLTTKNYNNFAANKKVRYDDTIKDDMKKFTLCLGSAAAIAPGKFSLNDCKDTHSTTEYDIMAQSVFLAIEGRMGENAAIMTMDYDAALSAYHNAMQKEYCLDPRIHQNSGQTRQLDLSIRSKVLSKRDAFFKNVWEAAIVMYNGIEGTGNSAVANSMGNRASYDPATGKLTLTVPCYGVKSVWDKYYSKAYVSEGPAWRILERSYDASTSTGTLVFQGPAGADLKQDPIGFRFPDSKLVTDLSSPLLYQFDLTDKKRPDGGYQTMFCAMQKTPTFQIKHSSSGSTGSAPGGDAVSPGSEGSVVLDIHRYKHSESWKSTYNVDLIKYDSETGKPLKGSKWDILEFDTLGSYEDGDTQLGSTYLDHPAEEAESIGTRYNWANDDGTQFERWEDGDEDPCSRDSNVTGADGYLYECNTIGEQSGTLAHADTHEYTYTKGYCTGHPEPVVTYYEEVDNPEDDPEIEEENEKIAEMNAELDALAQESWQQQVDYCEQLAAEGGFFHTMDPGDSAKRELEEDRDQFYNDFISLTYEYSAEEISARTGYLLHGEHPDDIPIERVVLHSSEYLSGDLSGISVSEEEMPAADYSYNKQDNGNKKQMEFG